MRLPGKGDSDSLGARPVFFGARPISMTMWIGTSSLSIKNSLSDQVYYATGTHEKLVGKWLSDIMDGWGTMVNRNGSARNPKFES